jgi:predicted nucleic acid-binding protein
MILVDTSVLIGYFKGESGVPYDTFNNIIEQAIPFGISNLIFQEVLQGAKTEKEFNLLKEYLLSIPFYNLKHETQSFEDVAFHYFTCRKAGITIRSSIDLIIAQTAIEHNLYLLHNDNDFAHIASVIKALKLYK